MAWEDAGGASADPGVHLSSFCHSLSDPEPSIQSLVAQTILVLCVLSLQ